MDPASIVGLVSACASIGQLLIQIQQTLNSIREKYKNAKFAITSLLSQLSILEAATSRLQAVLAVRQHRGADKNGEHLLPQLNQSLVACATSIELLASHVASAKAALDAGLTIGRRARARYIFNEEGIAPIREALRDQIQAIHFLLYVVSLETKDEQSTALLDTENSEMLHRVANRSSSLMWLRDPASVASFASRATDSMSRASIIFGFDAQLLDTKLYRGAVITAWRKLRRPSHDDNQLSNDEDEARILAPIPRELGMQITGHDPVRDSERPLTLLVKWDFQAEHPSELCCLAGDVIVPIRIVDNDWVVARPADNSNPPGMVPIGYLSVRSIDGSECTSVEEARETLLDVLRIQDTSPELQDQPEPPNIDSPNLGRIPPSPEASDRAPGNTADTYQSLRVGMDDSYSKVLSAALHTYRIKARPDEYEINLNGGITVVVVLTAL
ncbi:SH3 domain-containing protein [Apiospora sp. TS-2023a]